MTGSAQIFLYASFCFFFRLSSQLYIDRRITKIGTNDRYHVQGLKVPIVNPRWPPKFQDGRLEIIIIIFFFLTFSLYDF